MATHANHNLVSSEDVEGTEVYSAAGDNIGTIDHMMIEKVSGRVTYAVMRFGGFLGMGDSHHPIPWSALKYDTNRGGYVTTITQDQLKSAPQFSDDSWNDRKWETKVHDNYQVPYYWGGEAGIGSPPGNRPLAM
jgi:hypothetical protein